MLVGRENELNILNASFRQMLEGKGNILFLTGEAGLGKTTLVHEWWKTVSPDSAIYAEAACSIPIGNVEVGTLEALQPWADVIAQLQGSSGKDNKKFDFKKLIHDAAPAWAWAIPFIGEIAHAAVETGMLIKEQRSLMKGNANAANQQQVFQQYVNLLTKIAEETPIVILLDDMHWADTSSTNLLFYLSRQITTKKILVIVTYRQEDATISNDGKGHPILSVKNEILRYESGKEMALGYLGGEAIREMMTNTFGDYQVNDKFEGWLKKISDGNSLFVTQFIKTLQEDGHLDGRGTFTGDYDGISIPSSALAVVKERTRRLDDETRELLSYATAEGEEFTSYVLGQLTSKKPLELLRDLRKAEAVGLVQSKKSTRQFANQTTSVFGFSHALFHKALYDALLPEERDILHRQCFEILKTEWDRQAAAQDKSMPLASKLLTHAEKCGELEAAADAALGAAQSAWRNYSESEAMEMLGHVKRLMGNADTGTKHSETLGTALLLEAEIHQVRGRYDDALRYAAEAYTQFESAHDTLKMVSVLNRKADLLRSKGLYEDSEQTARNALALIENDKSRAIESRTHEAAALNIIGNVNTLRGKYAEGLEYYAKCLAIQESNNDLTGIVVSLNNMGIIHFFRGNYGEALELYKKSLAICEPLGDRVRLGQSFNNIGAAHSARGEYEEALKYHTKSLNVREAIGDRAGIGMSLGNIGNLHSTRGEYEEALQWHEKSLAIREAIGERSGVAASLTDIGLEYCKLGKFHEALDYSNKSLAVWEEIGDRGGSIEALQNIGVAYRMQGDLAKSRPALERAHATAAETGKKEYMYMTMFELGLLCEAEAKQGDERKRSEKLIESLNLIEEAATTLREMDSKYATQCETELERIKKIVIASE